MFYLNNIFVHDDAISGCYFKVVNWRLIECCYYITQVTRNKIIYFDNLEYGLKEYLP